MSVRNKCQQLSCMGFCCSCSAWKSCSLDLRVGDFGKRERAWRVTEESLVVLAREREHGEPLGIVESIKVEMGWTAGRCIGPYWKVAREKYISTGWSGCS